MKSFLCIFAVCTSACLAQTDGRVALELGTATVWLGMDRAVAKQTLEASGLTLPDSDTSNPKALLTAVNLRTKRVYNLQFLSNRLVYASRNWLHEGDDGLPSVMDALASLTDQGATKCTIETAPISSPETRVKRVFIDCGLRGLILVHGSVTTSVGPMTDNRVIERIGNSHSDD
jgi:hypothetical protein